MLEEGRRGWESGGRVGEGSELYGLKHIRFTSRKMQRKWKNVTSISFLIKVNNKGVLTNSPVDIAETEAGVSQG